jgi:hypothetical protein
VRLVAVAAVVAIATACGPAPSTVPLPTPEISCSETRFDPPPKLTCGAAVAAAWDLPWQAWAAVFQLRDKTS